MNMKFASHLPLVLVISGVLAKIPDIEGNYILKGHREKRDGKTYLKADSLDIKLNWKDYSLRLENLFNGDKTLGESVNQVLNENRRELMDVLIPRVQEACSRIFLKIANQILSHFTEDELFPL